jgi:mono/diheme cytochrome c family protein
MNRCTMAVAALLTLVVIPAAAADAGRGALLYENHCTVCHTSVVHLRENRIAQSPADVRAQVLRWSTHLNLDWGDEEVSDVVEYLSDSYYRFKQ